MSLLDAIGQFSDFAGACGGLASAAGIFTMLRERLRSLERIEILLKIEGEGFSGELPLEMLRKDVSRAELLGRLGMALKNQGQRFALKALSTPAFMRAINDVAEGKSSVLVIPCSREEAEQFAVELTAR
jgi:hypothetical protein